MIVGAYRLHGRLVRIERAGDEREPADIRMRLVSGSDLPVLDERRARTVFANASVRLTVETMPAGDRYRLRFGTSGWTDCLIEPGGTEVLVCRPSGRTEGLLELLLGPVLGWCLRLSGVLCLHAGAVAVDNSACLLLGPSGAGKSTLAAALTERGHTLLADEFVTIVEIGEAGARVPPGSSAVRLTASSLQALHAASWSESASYLDAKRRLTPVAGAPSDAVPLGRIYLLERSSERSVPRIDRSVAAAGLIAVLGHLYPPLMPQDQERRQRELVQLTGALQHARLSTLRLPDDLARIGEACALVEADAAGN